MPPISAGAAGAAEPVSWPSRYLAPRAARPRSDLAAGLAVAALLAELLLAQATLVLVIGLLAAGRLSRWRPLWLALPAAAGITWMLATGAGPTLAGYCAVARHVIADLTGSGPMLARLDQLPAVLAAWRRWLPAQTPLALVAASAQALLVTWLGRRARPWQYRPGAVIAVRSAYLAGTLRRGEVATADGGCVGVVAATGRRAAVSWQEAQAGMVCTGRDPAGVTATGLGLATAAIQHRKTVIVIDLTAGAATIGGGHLGGHPAGRPLGGPLGGHPAGRPLGGPLGGHPAGRPLGGRPLGGVGGRTPDSGVGGRTAADLPGLVGSACADAGAPLRSFGGPAGHYEPMSGPVPGGAAGLIMAMIDWTGMSHARQVFCAGYLDAALTVIAAGRPAPVLDELVSLLRPGELAGRSRQLPGHLPGREALAGRITELAVQLDADPGATAPVAAQLARLRSAPLGRWLCQPRIPARGALPGKDAISLGQALVDREVVLFALDRRVHGWSAVMIARLVVADLSRILAERSELGAPADCLVWINGCEVISPRQIAELVAAGQRAGTAVLLGTAEGAAAARLASELNVIAVRGPAPAELAGSDAAQDRDDRVREPGSASLSGPAEFPGGQETAAPDAAGWPGGVSFETNSSTGLPMHLLRAQHPDILSLRVRSPRPRIVTGCRAVR